MKNKTAQVLAWLVFGAALDAALYLLSLDEVRAHHASQTTMGGLFLLAYAAFALIVAVMA